MPELFDVSNYPQAWQGSALLNGVIITLGSVLALVAIGSICAYVIARRGGRLG